MHRPVIVSITTLPSRIGRMRPCLDSLLSGVAIPDKIYVAVPPSSRRERCTYQIPDFLHDGDFCGSVIKVVAAERDWGPGTKLLGSLSVIPNDCYLVLADDDVKYGPSFLSGLLSAQRADHSSSFSYYTYRAEGVTIGQGCDGFSFFTPHLVGIRSFAEEYVEGTDLFFHDDLWISFYLASRGVTIRNLSSLLGPSLIYQSLYKEIGLSHLSGDLARDMITRRGVHRLLREVNMSTGTKLKIRTVAAYDKVVSEPIKRMKRRVSGMANLVSAFLAHRRD